MSVLCANLTDNAIKYTPKGKAVFIELKDKILMIKDEGIGIGKKIWIMFLTSFSECIWQDLRAFKALDLDYRLSK
ncbi:ATP-binding protein [Sulfurospirillum sp. 1612]|uniref:ATP-binding protein n=1 Tax=Sulfurospirillum sp. 1612 TaxID=3094835 RepID=UPI002F95BACF